MKNKLQPTTRPQRLGRPRKEPDVLRTEELRLYLNIAEKQKLLDDAHAAGLRPADYLRQLIAGHQPAAIEGKTFGNPRLLLELSAIGNNLNQAVRDMHSGSKRKQDWQQLQSLLKAAIEKVALNDVC